MLGRFIKKERNRNPRGLLLLQIHVVDFTQYVSTTLSRWPAPGHDYFILLLLKEKKFSSFRTFFGQNFRTLS